MDKGLSVSFLSDSMLKHLETAFETLGYDAYSSVQCRPGSEISVMSGLAKSYCQDSDLIVIKTGINNLLNGYSVSNCIHLYKKTLQSVQETCPTAHVAFMDVSYVAKNEFTGIDTSGMTNSLIDELNASLEDMCNQNDRTHFIDLSDTLRSNDGHSIDRRYLAYDGLHYSRRGTDVVANALIHEVEALKCSIVTNARSVQTVNPGIENVWPDLPSPAVKSRIHPASFPGQQYVDVKVKSRTLHHTSVNKSLSKTKPQNPKVNSKRIYSQKTKSQNPNVSSKHIRREKLIKKANEHQRSFKNSCQPLREPIQTPHKKRIPEDHECIVTRNRYAALSVDETYEYPDRSDVKIVKPTTTKRRHKRVNQKHRRNSCDGAALDKERQMAGVSGLTRVTG